MSDEIESLRAEIAALREELTEQRESTVSRRRLIAGLAGLGAASAAGVASSAPAKADDGDNLVLGEENTAASPTQLYVSLDQVIRPENALRIRMEDPAEPVSLESPPDPALLVESAITAVTGYGMFNGVHGVTDHGVGVLAEAQTDSGVALWALSVRGPTAILQSGDGVALRLEPSSEAGPPQASYNYEVGSISVDETGQPWLCVADGTPGTWTRLLREDTAAGRTIAITPMRALDTRATNGRPPGSPAVPGQKKGPLRGGEALTLDLAGVSPIPGTAAGVLGNLTVVSPTYNGYLVAGPSGTTPTTSALNFTTGATVANAFTSLLGPSGLTLKASGTTTNRYELIVDITAYIT